MNNSDYASAGYMTSEEKEKKAAIYNNRCKLSNDFESLFNKLDPEQKELFKEMVSSIRAVNGAYNGGMIWAIQDIEQVMKGDKE